MLDAGGFLDAVCVVKQHTQIADAADTGLRTHGGLSGFDARVAENAFFRLAAFPVVVNFLVRTAADTHPPAAALVLVDQHNAVFLALVDRARRAARHARRIEAVFAQPRQVHHEGVLELAVDVLLDVVEISVGAALAEFAAEDFLPVRPPNDLVHLLAGDQAARPRSRRGAHLRRTLQVTVVEGERLVVIVDLGQVGVGENPHQQLPFRALPWLDVAIALANPAAIPLVLVLPFLGVTDAGLGLDVVEPGVFHARPAGPDVLAGDRTGVTADALVQVQHHADLRAYLHTAS